MTSGANTGKKIQVEENCMYFPILVIVTKRIFVHFNLYVMITGTHAIIYSSNAEADKAFFKDVLKLTNVDVGNGWLIFGLPPSELAVHPDEGSTTHELYLMCEDIKLFIEEMSKHNISCTEPQDEGWGILTQLTLPGGGLLGVYQPRHERPEKIE
jgi:hypothetical protein